MFPLVQKMAIILLITLLISGCESMTTREGVGAGIGGILGAIGGNVLADKLGVDRGIGTALGAAAGATIGMKIGSALDKYFGENDQKNLKTLLDDDKPQRAAWCSDKEGKPSGYTTPTRNVNAVQCSSGNKIIQSLGASKRVKTSEGEQVCKTSKTEVSNAGNPETISTTMCKKSDGTWYEKTT
jgi:phage tail tape-measure protein